MDEKKHEKKRVQILMLVFAVLILAAAGAGWYWLGVRPKEGGNRVAGAGRTAQDPSMAGEAGVTAGVTAGGGSGGAGLAADGGSGGAGLAAGSGSGEAGQATGQESGGTMGENGNSEGSGEPGEIRDGLILLEGGTFRMGSPEGERQREPDEVSHEVTISAFYIDPFEVTQRDYEAVMGEDPSYFQGEDLYDVVLLGYPNMEQGFESVLCV